jgi:hypothetical protein
MNCQQCGHALPADAGFCSVCGTPVPRGFPSGETPLRAAPFVTGAGNLPPRSGPEGMGIPTPPGAIGDCLRVGWEVFQRQWGMLFVIGLVYTAISSGPNAILGRTFHDQHGHRFVVNIGAGILSMFFYPGVLVASLKAVRGARVEFSDLFVGFRRFGTVLAWSVLSFVGIFLSFLMLVVPGVIVALGWSQSAFLIFDRGMGAVDSLRASWGLMRGYRMPCFLLQLACLGLFILGLLALCVGALVATPVIAVIQAVFYERLRQWNGQVLTQPWAPPPPIV